MIKILALFIREVATRYSCVLAAHFPLWSCLLTSCEKHEHLRCLQVARTKQAERSVWKKAFIVWNPVQDSSSYRLWGMVGLVIFLPCLLLWRKKRPCWNYLLDVNSPRWCSCSMAADAACEKPASWHVCCDFPIPGWAALPLQLSEPHQVLLACVPSKTIDFK